MRDVGSKTFGTYDEFKEAFTSFDLKTTVLGYRLCVHNRVGSYCPQKLAFEVQMTEYEVRSLWTAQEICACRYCQPSAGLLFHSKFKASRRHSCADET